MTARIALAVLVLAACTDTRQIVLSIDTTAGVPCDIDRVRIRASSSGAPATVFEQALDDVRLPLAITLLDDTPAGDFAIEVVGVKGEAELLLARGNLRFTEGKATVPVMLDAQCTVDAPCELSEPAGGAPPSARVACGPLVTRYAIEDTAEIFEDACSVPGAGKVLVDDSRGPVRLDDLAGALPGFGFWFYGRPLRQIWVHRDGFIAFGRDDPDPAGDLDPGALDRNIVGAGAPPPPQSVMVFWDDLHLRDQIGICYSLQGAPGTQVLRVTWSRACFTFPCTTDSLNFTIALDEASQKIALTYGVMMSGTPERAQGSAATVGIVDQAGGCPQASQCTAETGLCSDGTPCGYSQAFSGTAQTPRVANKQLTPIVDAR
jgi:hypothetical protein